MVPMIPKDGRVVDVAARGRVIGWFLTEGFGVRAWSVAPPPSDPHPLGYFPTWRAAGDAVLIAAGLPPVPAPRRAKR